MTPTARRLSALLVACAAASAACRSVPKPGPDFKAVKAKAQAAFEGQQADADRPIEEDARRGLPKPAAPPAPKPATPAELPKPGSAEPEAPKTLDVASEAPVKTARKLGNDPAGCAWWESEALITAGDNDTKALLSGAAIDRARVTAMKDALGVQISNQTDVLSVSGVGQDVNLVSDILKTTRSGYILKETVLDEGYRDAADCRSCRYYARIKTCLAQAAGGDPDFHVAVQISQSNFVEGNEGSITVTPSQDGYLYVYDLLMNFDTYPVIPNEVLPMVKVRAGETWTYPDEELRRRGVKLVAQLPKPGMRQSAETIKVILSKAPLPKEIYDSSKGGWMGVIRRLRASKFAWAEDTKAFAIISKE